MLSESQTISHPWLLQSDRWSPSKRPKLSIKALQDRCQEAHILKWQPCARLPFLHLDVNIDNLPTNLRQGWGTNASWECLVSAAPGIGTIVEERAGRDAGFLFRQGSFQQAHSQRCNLFNYKHIQNQWEYIHFHINIYCRGGIFYVHAITILHNINLPNIPIYWCYKLVIEQ